MTRSPVSATLAALLLIPALGRWAQRDPIGYSGGRGLYCYVRSSPAGGRDPFGLVRFGTPDAEVAGQ